jgi:3-hydroxymyristoyl/3-hydroxydecanoyl-(acyl carrier protein) dehydratase
MTGMSAFRSLLPRELDSLDHTFLPVGHMRQISRVMALDGPRIAGIVELSPGPWIWPQHFPSDPIFPGSLIIEAAGQLVALWAWAAGHRGRPRLVRTSAKFHHPVTPAAARIELEGEVRSRRHLLLGIVEAAAGSTIVARVEIGLAVLPR